MNTEELVTGFDALKMLGLTGNQKKLFKELNIPIVLQHKYGRGHICFVSRAEVVRAEDKAKKLIEANKQKMREPIERNQMVKSSVTVSELRRFAQDVNHLYAACASMSEKLDEICEVLKIRAL